MEFSWGSETCIQDERARRRRRRGIRERANICLLLRLRLLRLLRLLVLQRRVCQQLQGASETTDGYGMQQRSAEAAAAAPYVARLPRFFRGDPSARGARSSRLHISEWGISLWREEGYGSTYDLVFTVGGRSLTSTIYMNEEAWHGMRRMLAPCRSHRWWFDSINRLFAPYSATDSFFGVIQQNSGGMSQRGAYLRSATGAPPFNSEKAFGFRPPFHL